MSTTPAAAASHDPEFLYEFDREPIPKSRLLGPGHFAGSYAGEHVAATEFVIGVTFVNWGASVHDIFLGLVIGNLLAVLTWTLVCAPIAVETRLTLYWYLQRIGGPRLTSIYNVVNALMYSILAGCMITVSASALRIPFGIPPQLDWYPTDFRFVLVVLGVGAVVVTLAVLGFKRLATFATVCSPWMFLMFIVGAIAVLPQLFASSEGGGFFEMARQAVWTGQTPDGSVPMGFWKVAAFAWICNLGMHGGLSDMALFRYAKKYSYGLYSSFGMFLGHYLAWICAGLMGAGAALLMGRSLVELDAGEVGFQALGWVGALAVVIAGWTTSQPDSLPGRLGAPGGDPELVARQDHASRRDGDHRGRVLSVRVYRTPGIRSGLRAPDFSDRRDRGYRALDLPPNRAQAVLGNRQGMDAQLGGPAGLGIGGLTRRGAGARRPSAPVLPVPPGVWVCHVRVLVPRTGHGGGQGAARAGSEADRHRVGAPRSAFPEAIACRHWRAGVRSHCRRGVGWLPLAGLQRADRPTGWVRICAERSAFAPHDPYLDLFRSGHIFLYVEGASQARIRSRRVNRCDPLGSAARGRISADCFRPGGAMALEDEAL